MSSLEASTRFSITKFLSFRYPISRFSPCSSLLIPNSSSNLSLSLSIRKRHRVNTIRPRSQSESEFESLEEEELAEFEDDVESDFDDVSDENLDVDELELEAENVVREYSILLSKELKVEEDPISEKGSHGRKKVRESIRAVNIPDHLLPKVSIVGRPNVGKSALFNRLVGGNKAIVVDEPGVTRDRLYSRSFWGHHEFMVIDTGGVLTVSKSQTEVMEQQLSVSTTIGMEGIPLASREAAVAKMPSMIERQATVAVEESSVIIFVVDGQGIYSRTGGGGPGQEVVSQMGGQKLKREKWHIKFGGA